MIRNDTDYALRMLLHLAEQLPKGTAALELSDRLGIPHSFAQKILHKLVRAEIIQSKPGQHGGFMMNIKTGDVSMMDVIVAIQGPPLLNRCTGKKDACAHQPSCLISTSLNTLQVKLNDFLCHTSLADILRGQPNSNAKTARFKQPRPTRRTTSRQTARSR